MTEPAAVDSIHDLHVWTLSSGLVALSAHVVIRDMNEWEAVLGELSVQLDRRFDIQHITLQPELMQRACSQGC